jgi:hypothetical protein
MHVRLLSRLRRPTAPPVALRLAIAAFFNADPLWSAQDR